MLYPSIFTAPSRTALNKSCDGIFTSGYSCAAALSKSEITPAEYGAAILVPQNLSQPVQFGTVDVFAPGEQTSGFRTSAPRDEKKSIISLFNVAPYRSAPTSFVKTAPEENIE